MPQGEEPLLVEDQNSEVEIKDLQSSPEGPSHENSDILKDFTLIELSKPIGDGPVTDQLFKKKSNKLGEKGYINKLESEVKSSKGMNLYLDFFDNGPKNDDEEDFLDKFAAISGLCVFHFYKPRLRKKLKPRKLQKEFL